MSNRKPQYATGDQHYRAVSVPNGFWLPQRRGNEPATRERDSWVAIGRPTNLQTAIARRDAVMKGAVKL
jgi:hypothetical protein